MESHKENQKPDLESKRRQFSRETFGGMSEAEKLALVTEVVGLGVGVIPWCDQRTDLDTEGLNAYDLPFTAEHDRVFSSATSNPMDQDGLDLVGKYLAGLRESLSEKKNYVEAVELLTDEFDRLREGLLSAMNSRTIPEGKPLLFPKGCEVVTGSNGTDVEYVSLLLAKHLAGPQGKIRNVFSKEMGGATPLACEGKFGNTKNWRGEMVVKGQAIKGLENITPVEIGVRTADRVRRLEEIEADFEGQFSAARESGEILIVHIVPATKTGERVGEARMVAGLCAKYPEVRVVKVADCAQGRTDEEEMAELVRDGFFVNLTASKFFEAPSFCAATIMNRENADQLSGAISNLVESGHFPDELAFYYSLADLPPGMREGLAGHLPQLPNLPLLVRWQVGEKNMKEYFSIPKKVRGEILRSLGSLVSTRLVGLRASTQKPWEAAQTAVQLSEVSFLIPGIETEAQAKLFRKRLADRGYWIPQVGGAIFRLAIGSVDVVKTFQHMRKEGSGNVIDAGAEYFSRKYAPLLNLLRELTPSTV